MTDPFDNHVPMLPSEPHPHAIGVDVSSRPISTLDVRRPGSRLGEGVVEAIAREVDEAVAAREASRADEEGDDVEPGEASQVLPDDPGGFAVDQALQRWLDRRRPSQGFVSYGEAFVMVATHAGILQVDDDGADPASGDRFLAGVHLPSRAELRDPPWSDVQAAVARARIRAHHVHLPVQTPPPNMLIDPGWFFDPARSVCWQRTSPEAIENMLWLEVSHDDLAVALGLAGQPQGETRDHDRRRVFQGELAQPAGQDDEQRELAMRLELRDGPRCKICESLPQGGLVLPDGNPPGWRTLGTLHDRLIRVCGSCLDVVRKL